MNFRKSTAIGPKCIWGTIILTQRYKSWSTRPVTSSLSKTWLIISEPGISTLICFSRKRIGKKLNGLTSMFWTLKLRHPLRYWILHRCFSSKITSRNHLEYSSGHAKCSSGLTATRFGSPIWRLSFRSWEAASLRGSEICSTSVWKTVLPIKKRFSSRFLLITKRTLGYWATRWMSMIERLQKYPCSLSFGTFTWAKRCNTTALSAADKFTRNLWKPYRVPTLYLWV